MGNAGSALRRLGPRRVLRVLVMTVLAIVLYGGWAFWVNHGEPPGVALRAAATQGGTSALSTLFTASLVELVFARLRLSWVAGLAAATLPPTLTGSMHAIAQWLAGTPGVLATVLPSVVMGYVFAGSYTVGLARLTRGRTSSSTDRAPPRGNERARRGSRERAVRTRRR
jgi:hypothetical protein